MNVGLRNTENNLQLLPEVTKVMSKLGNIKVRGNLIIELKDVGSNFWGKATGTALKSSSGIMAEGKTAGEVMSKLGSAIEEQVYPVKVTFRGTPETLYKENGELLKGISKNVDDLHKLETKGTVNFEIKDLGGHRFSVVATGELVNGKLESTNLSPEKAVADIVKIVKSNVHRASHKAIDAKKRARKKESLATNVLTEELDIEYDDENSLGTNK